ncbi:DNA methylase [Amycolatopsis sp. NBC_01307]|uniref:DNA methylase n=1 Tax=Amycolatopsis sp. NBC_01307 TaxID=2903561 RepID=UPI002E0D76BA|nr:DNA methylase [Amycolatopsis sp. NBC_01307]
MPAYRPLLLDLFCKAGGAAKGYHDAGFDVIGVDIEPQPHYPYAFYQADALDFIARHGTEFDAIHASPPCQAFTLAQRIQRRTHPDMIVPTRTALVATGRPWVIENVEGAPLHQPITLCGAMFPGLNVYRHRLFETSFPVTAPPEPAHREPLTKMGRPPRPGDRMHVVGNFSGVRQARAAMGIDWMARNELSEAIPPAYTRHIGTALLARLAAAPALPAAA